jgi:hypothetical protein
MVLDTKQLNIFTPTYVVWHSFYEVDTDIYGSIKLISTGMYMTIIYNTICIRGVLQFLILLPWVLVYNTAITIELH